MLRAGGLYDQPLEWPTVLYAKAIWALFDKQAQAHDPKLSLKQQYSEEELKLIADIETAKAEIRAKRV